MPGKTPRQCARRWKRVRAAIQQALERDADGGEDGGAIKPSSSALRKTLPRIGDLTESERLAAEERLQALKEVAETAHTAAEQLARQMAREEQAAADAQEEDDDAWWSGSSCQA